MREVFTFYIRDERDSISGKHFYLREEFLLLIIFNLVTVWDDAASHHSSFEVLFIVHDYLIILLIYCIGW